MPTYWIQCPWKLTYRTWKLTLLEPYKNIHGPSQIPAKYLHLGVWLVVSISLKFIPEMFLNLRLRLHIATGFGWVGWVAQAFPHMKGWFTEITLSTCAATKSISGDSTCAVFQQCFRGHSGRWSRLSSGPVWVATRCVCHIFF